MFLTLTDVLEVSTLRDLRAGLAGAQWEDGRATTGAAARARKNNLQVSAQEPRLGEWSEIVLRALAQHPMMRFLVMPKRFMPPVFNRYDTGMYYQDHVDFPLLGPEPRMRADLSLTLFLSAPEEYTGGELVIGASDGERRIKLPAGQAIVYPASTLHRVEAVRGGARLAVVTTIQSHVRGEAERALLADVVTLWRRIEDQAPAGEEVRLAAKIHHNLIRLWAD